MNYERIMKSAIIALVIIAIGILAGTKSLVNAQGDSELNQQLAQVRRATAKYHDINVAIADGFVPVPLVPALIPRTVRMELLMSTPRVSSHRKLIRLNPRF